MFLILFQCGSGLSKSKNNYLRNGFMRKLENLNSGCNLLKSTGEEKQSAFKTKIRQRYNLKPETLKMLSKNTMDIIPHDTVIAEAHDLNWAPRPIFQSYSAYTEYLDSLNAKYFSESSAPEYILYTVSSIDDRYPIFDEPATFRTLLQKYKPCGQDGNFLILRKKPSPDVYTEEIIKTETVKFRDIIPTPPAGNRPLFAKIYVDLNFPGLVRNSLFKPPIVYIVFLNGEKIIGDRSWRLVTSNATNGVYVSKYIDMNSLLEAWKGNNQQDITGIALVTEHPAFFKKKIRVEFFTTSIKE
jgi:hypothetical protein